jgi:P4 family phage/plasmid primase-like protien
LSIEFRRYTPDDFEFLPEESAPKLEQVTRMASIGNIRIGTDFTREEKIRRAAAYVAKMPAAVENKKGDSTTYNTACRIARDFDLDSDDALTVLRPWNARCRPPWDENDLLVKIQNAFKYGNGEVGTLLKETPAAAGEVNSKGFTQASRSVRSDQNRTGEADYVGPDVEGILTTADGTTAGKSGLDYSEIPTQYSDDAIAGDFSAAYGNDLKFVPEWGWLEWDGQRWKRVPDVVVMQKARRSCRWISRACSADPELSESKRDQLARSIASAKTVAAIERLARGDRRHFSSVSEWDSHPWLFNTPGGTVDLKTGALREHRRDDRITKISNATPNGDCPVWTAFLDRVTNGNRGLQAYVQRLAGYSLCGDPCEESLDFFHGPGGNGKGTFLSTLQYTHGEYATTAASDMFMESRGDKHPCDVAKLAGARLVVAQEVDEGKRWDEARIKSMTGRDMMTGRFMRQDFFDFMPEFTLIISGNNKPALKTVDDAIRRRFHLVPFTVSIPPDERDLGLKEALRQEANGILAWAIAGFLDWQDQGLNPPAVVLDATNEYLEEEDVIGQWVRECCSEGPNFEEPSGVLYSSFRVWKLDRGEQPPGQKKFSSILSDRGYARGRSATARKFTGIQLTEAARKTANAALERENREGRSE